MIYQPVLDGLAALACREHFLPLALQSFREAVGVFGVPHLGPLYTRSALTALDVDVPPLENLPGWVLNAREQARRESGPWAPPSTESVLSVASLDVSCGPDRLTIPLQLFFSGAMEGAAAPVLELFGSVERQVPRDDH